MVMASMSREQIEAMVNLATNGSLYRIDQRAKRGAELRQWGLNPQRPQPGSPLAADDAAFEHAYPEALSGGQGVTEESLFPMMSAAECLGAVETLVGHRQAGSLFAVPIMQLCRSAMETSARTIWILSQPERAERVERAFRVLVAQLEQQKRFLAIEERNMSANKDRFPAELLEMNREHRRRQAALVQTLNELYPLPAPDGFGKTIAFAATWVDKHLPAHDTGELAANGMHGGSTAFYSWGSSLVHGYKWAVDYARGVRLFPMIADSLAAAVFMTECAVCLYEAARRAPGGQRSSDSLIPEGSAARTGDI
ncbi:hypothetical protein MHAS44199_24020 [Mycolicibacterium hassiacum DSM 44199]|nr:hypothetical protein [Mycolicibacterium hassiacum DSM 44199]